MRVQSGLHYKRRLSGMLNVRYCLWSIFVSRQISLLAVSTGGVEQRLGCVRVPEVPERFQVRRRFRSARSMPQRKHEERIGVVCGLSSWALSYRDWFGRYCDRVVTDQSQVRAV